jgi:hypothetical protein
MTHASLMKKLQRTATLRTAGFLLVLATAFSPVSRANGILWSTGTGGVPGPQSNGTEQVWTDAFIALDGTNHRITITLENLGTDPPDIKGVLGSVQIDLAFLSSGTFSTKFDSTANLSGVYTGGKAITTQVALNGNGNVTSVTNNVTSTWATQQVGTANTLTLCDICPVSDGSIGSPAHMGLPKPNASGNYSNMNNSGTGASHQPLTLMSGTIPTFSGSGLATPTNAQPTWVLDVPLVNNNTIVTAVRFYYGSLYDTTVASTATVEIPEPGATSMIVGGVLLILAGAWTRRRRSKKSQTPLS